MSPCEHRAARRSSEVCRQVPVPHAAVNFDGNLSVPLFSVLSPGCSLTLGALTASFALRPSGLIFSCCLSSIQCGWLHLRS